MWTDLCNNGDGTARSQITEEDLQDTELLGELREVSGGVDFGESSTAAAAGGGRKDGGGGAGGYGGDGDDVVEPDRESDDEINEAILADGDLQEEVGPTAVPGAFGVAPLTYGLQRSKTHAQCVCVVWDQQHVFLRRDPARPCLSAIFRCPDAPPPTFPWTVPASSCGPSCVNLHLSH